MNRRIIRIIFTALMSVSVFCLSSCSSDHSEDDRVPDVTEIHEDIRCTSFMIRGKETEITDEMNEKLSEFFSVTDTESIYDLELALDKYIEIYFSSGSSIILGDNDKNIVFYRKDEDDKGKLISISEEFKKYIDMIAEEKN